MQILEIDYGYSPVQYKTIRRKANNFDIEVLTESGDVIEVNTRLHGYAVRLVNKEGRKTLVNYGKIGGYGQTILV